MFFLQQKKITILIELYFRFTFIYPLLNLNALENLYLFRLNLFIFEFKKFYESKNLNCCIRHI